MVKRLEGKKNPLKSQIDNGSESFVPRFQKALSTVINGEKFFVLENIQLKRGFPEFVDAQIFIKSVKDPHQRRIMDNLHDVSALKVGNWKSQMLYPYTHQFILFDEIKGALNGFGRFTYYRCFSKNEMGEYDPSFSTGSKENWLMEIKEGEFKAGMADGYQR